MDLCSKLSHGFRMYMSMYINFGNHVIMDLWSELAYGFQQKIWLASSIKELCGCML